MAASKCVRCENGTFEIVEISPRNAKFVHTAVQCTKCGGVAGVLYSSNVAHQLDMIEKHLKKQDDTLSAITAAFR